MYVHMDFGFVCDCRCIDFLAILKYVWQLQWALGKNVKCIILYTFLGFDYEEEEEGREKKGERHKI